MRVIGRVAILSIIAILPVVDVVHGAPAFPLTPPQAIPKAAPRSAPKTPRPKPTKAPATQGTPSPETPSSGTASNSECKNPNAIGTSRVITVDPNEHGRIGHMNYAESLPLNDHEVVLTFDDGPLPPYTSKVLSTLASQCVKATFFLVGKMAREFPSLVRREYLEGHTVASHSQSHPHNMQHMTAEDSQSDIDAGIESVSEALKDTGQIAPFFRFPGFAHTKELEANLASRGIMVWSADFPADDWKHISSRQVMARALSRLQQHGRGVLLLHDIQPATVLALPELLRELKKRNFKIVHVVPSSPDRPKTDTEPEQWVKKEPAPERTEGRTAKAPQARGRN